MSRPRTRREVVARFADSPSEVKRYFEHLDELVENYPWEIALSYMFWRVELAQTNTIYCGIVKLHAANAQLARKVVDSYRLSRPQFKEKFSMVFGRPLSQTLSNRLGKAEKVRDRVIHGKTVHDADEREAVLDILDFAEGFNAFVYSLAGFKPFGNLRGFKGR